MRHFPLRLVLAVPLLGLLPGAAGPVAAQDATGSAAVASGTPFRPVATVNQAMITAWDVEQRARLLAALGAQAPSSQQMANAALDDLIESRLMLQAGRDAGLDPDAGMVRSGLAELADQLGRSAEALRRDIAGAGVTEQAITDMIGAQMVWREVVRARFAARIEPGEADIDAEIALSDARQGEAYRLQEIALPIGGGELSEAETRSLAESLARTLDQGATLAEVRDRLPAGSEVREGDWVQAEAMAEPLLRVVSGLDRGGASAPLSVPGGLVILRVADRRDGGTVDSDDPVLRERVRRRLVGDRIERLAQGLIQELRRDALIELR